MLILGVDVGVKVIDLRRVFINFLDWIVYMHPYYVQWCLEVFKQLVTTSDVTWEKTQNNIKEIGEPTKKIDCIFEFLVDPLLVLLTAAFLLVS